jgi:hypothetical protein
MLGQDPESTGKETDEMKEIRRTLDRMGAETRQALDDMRARMREQYDAVDETLVRQQEALVAHGEAIVRLQEANVQTHRALARQAHVLDEGLAQAADAFERQRENVGTVIYAVVDDLNALKTEVRSISSRVEALEGPPAPAA